MATDMNFGMPTAFTSGQDVGVVKSELTELRAEVAGLTVLVKEMKSHQK
jgi:hypothetical protein